MSAETFRAVVTAMIICALGGLTIPGIFAVFALQSRVSRRNDYLILLCDAFFWIKPPLNTIKGGCDSKALAISQQIDAVFKRAEISEFFEPECSLTMETYIRHFPNRYAILRDCAREIVGMLRKLVAHQLQQGDQTSPELASATSDLADASAKTESFESSIGRIKWQIWPPWFIGIGVVVVSLIVLHTADLSSIFLGILVLRPILFLLLIGVVCEFAAATNSVRVILHELDR
jgi:hypothetical protein